MSDGTASKRDVTAAIREALTPELRSVAARAREDAFDRHIDKGPKVAFEMADQAWQSVFIDALRPVIAGHEDVWQDIATAPRDTTLVLVGLLRDGVLWRASDAAFNGLGWYTKNGSACHWATHWHRLPADAHAAGVGPEPERKGPKCINCGVDDDGGYMAEDGPGPFCSLCWGALEDEFIKRAPNMSEDAPPAPAAPGEGETCLCAAVLLADGYIVRGHRHDDCLQTAGKLNRSLHGHVQGFLTTRGRFVDRKEGMQLQIAANVPSDDGGYRGDILFSEDLY